MSKTRALNHKHAYELADRFAEQALRSPPQKNAKPWKNKPPSGKIEALRSTRQVRPTAEFVNPDASCAAQTQGTAETHANVVVNVFTAEVIMSSSMLNVSTRQKIVTALSFGSMTDEVAECLDVPYETVCSVAEENAALISHMMADRNKLARKHDAGVRKEEPARYFKLHLKDCRADYDITITSNETRQILRYHGGVCLGVALPS